MATVATERKVFVGGEWVETGDWVEVRSPYSGEAVGRVAKAGAAETRRAIDAAERAMAEPLPAHKRAEILVRVAGYLGRRHDEVARTISDEAGKPMKAARVEAKRAMSTYTMAAGCAVVSKPASQTPLSALLLAELEEEAGLPPGWLSVVVGPSAEIGDVLVEDERVRALTFTGSGEVGWKLRERAPRKRVNLELGNATPVVVAADADLDEAATKLAANAFSFAGQSCISVQRIYVERPAYDGFVEQFIPRVEALKIGDPADEETDVGPVIDEGARERILDWIEEARSGGARILTGGDLDGELIRPTVIADAAPDLKVSCEEVFGPVCTVNTVDSLDEAIELANGTQYGLQAGIFTGGLRPALDLARRLEFGGVTINEAPTFRADQMPYGGVKGPRNTREGPAYAVRELTEERLVVVDL